MALLLALVLRVCADPNNMPFSNRAGEGFENAMARMMARELGAELRYTWLPQRRGFVRNTMGADKCDVMMEVPAGYGRTLSTRPWYRSSYVFVYRKDRGISLHSFDDESLRALRIGVQMVGDDYANTPPAHALGKRGLARNVVGFELSCSRRSSISSPTNGIVFARKNAALARGPCHSMPLPPKNDCKSNPLPI